jgi:hypothetical protein
MAHSPERPRPQNALVPEDQPTPPTTGGTGKRAAPADDGRSPTKRRKRNEETTETALTDQDLDVTVLRERNAELESQLQILNECLASNDPRKLMRDAAREKSTCNADNL